MYKPRQVDWSNGKVFAQGKLNLTLIQDQTRSYKRGLNETLQPGQVFKRGGHKSPATEAKVPISLTWGWLCSVFLQLREDESHRSPVPITSLLPSLPPSDDRLMASSGTSWVQSTTGDSNIELTELISTGSLFRPGLWRRFSLLTSSWPPPPEEL